MSSRCTAVYRWALYQQAWIVGASHWLSMVWRCRHVDATLVAEMRGRIVDAGSSVVGMSRLVTLSFGKVRQDRNR